MPPLSAPLACLLLLAATAPLSAQGPLAPSAGPGPDMKTLRQIEPRTDLQASPAPSGISTSDPNIHFVISAPGSYYLSSNLAATKPSAISITVSGVTLDLNGFEISHIGRVDGTAISVGGGLDRVVVKDGSIRAFDRGVNAGTARGLRVSNLSVSNCGDSGIRAGNNAVVENVRLVSCVTGLEVAPSSIVTRCVASTCSFRGIFAEEDCVLTDCTVEGFAPSGNMDQGIFASNGSTLRRCTVAFCRTSNGFYVNQGCTLEECSVQALAVPAGVSSGGGFSTGPYCNLTGCVSTYNHPNSSTYTAVIGYGFSIGNGSLITRCTAGFNSGSGIICASDCIVRGNNVVSNGTFGPGPGIYATGTSNRIEDNQANQNDVGFQADGIRNLIVRNSARSNGKNYVIVAGNRLARIVVPAANAALVDGANSGSADGFTDVDPWANFTY